MGKQHQARRARVVVAPTTDSQYDFDDPESQGVQQAGALAPATELGRQTVEPHRGSPPRAAGSVEGVRVALIARGEPEHRQRPSPLTARSRGTAMRPATGALAHDDTDLPLLLIVPEVAQLLRTTPKAVYVLHARGLLPGVTRLGTRLLFRRAELLEWLRQKSAPSPRGSGR